MNKRRKQQLTLAKAMFLSVIVVVLSAPVFSNSPIPSSTVTNDQKQLDNKQVEDYLMGKFNPANHPAFVKVPGKYANREGYYLRKSAFEAFKRMHEAARKDGVKLIIRSATRNFDYQKRIWERKWRVQSKSRSALEKARNILKLNSMPSTSRHHWGTEIDLNAFRNDWFESGKGLKLFRWLENNAEKYGFHRPYTKKDASRPNGYNEEKWHWSYTPLSIPMTRDAALALDDSKIKGFTGSETAPKIGIVKNYILGVSDCCR